MALTTEQIDELIDSLPRQPYGTGSRREDCRELVREVRKQDDALIRQLVEALGYSSPNTNVAYAWQDERWALKRSEAITAGRARLENT